MIDIRTLTNITQADLDRVITGYTATTQYVVTREGDDTQMALRLRLETLPAPRVVRYDTTDADTLARYQGYLSEECSFGAYAEDVLVGIAIAEHQVWNNILWVWEFHIGEGQRGAGIGRQLMEALVALCEARGIRAIVCETQTRNTPAMAFYRRMGFALDGIDLSYYTNDDVARNDVAVFMKRRIG
jgi:ribosomal protein S18 acetylase RimI-like enzyme